MSTIGMSLQFADHLKKEFKTMFTLFFTGVIVTLVLLAAGAAYAYQTGLLRQFADRLANDDRNRSRRRLNKFLDRHRALRNDIEQLNKDTEELLSQLSQDLMVLSVNESLETARSIYDLSVSLNGAMADTTVLTRKVIGGEPETRKESTVGIPGVKKEQPSPEAKADFKSQMQQMYEDLFDEDEDYAWCPPGASAREWKRARGSDLIRRVRKGEVPGQDFFFAPATAMMNR